MQEVINSLKKKYPNFEYDIAAIDQIRKRMLRFLLLAYCVMGVLLALTHYAKHNFFLLGKMLFFTGLSWLGIEMLRRGASIQKVGHYVLICLCLIIVSTTYLYEQVHYLVTLQFIFIILSLGFYILGAGWGLFYSFLSIFIVGLLFIFIRYVNVGIENQAFDIDNYALTFSLLYNYLVLLYIHYFFFKESALANAKETTLLNELKISATQAHDLAQYKTNFLITMSHEIRTPLHAIIGGLDLFDHQTLNSDQQKNLDFIRFSGDLLNSIVNDILNSDEIEGKEIKLSKKAFQPILVVRDIYNSLQAAATTKGLELMLNTSPDDLNTYWVNGDPVRLAQIVMNLVSNAINYTEHGSVEIAVHVKQVTNDRLQVVFQVADTGIGIPAEVMPYIFEPFKLVKMGMKKQYHGTGLGLSLVQRLVKLHGSELNFSSQEGVGTSFFFELYYPVSQVPNAPENHGVDREFSPLAMTVLIAEDNHMNALILTKFLKKWGVAFDIAVNGLEAVEYMKNNNYQVILMDINMPLMDGVEASQKIRAFEDPSKAKIPIIALTATSKETLESNGTYRIFDDFISKPFHPQILYGKLAELSLSFPRIPVD